ncbi:MAG TPA: glycosyltransferase family 9 protein [Candidatus Manganitrophaceae bacterium]|nr:glycosyltransferase family 9 protein [Candidatus Manganitrophaceae bacterium]
MLERKEVIRKDAPPLSEAVKKVDFREILIIKPSSLGDIIHALPAVGVIRKRFDRARISWLVKPEWSALLKGHPFIDEAITAPFTWGSLPELIRSVRRRRFDLVVDLQGLFRSAFLGWVTGAPVRLGFADGREGAPWFYTDRVAVPAGVDHAVDRYRVVAKALGGLLREADFGLTPPPEAVSSADRLLAEAGLAGAAFAIIHPTARWENKKWPAERFAALGDWLIAEKKMPLLFIGGPGEREEVARVISMMKEPAFNAAGKSSLLESAELIRRARFFICNDSGPMHLAAAMKTPLFALFGPTDPGKVGPYGAAHTVIQKKIDCFGCGRGRCARENQCMKAISVEEVQQAIEEKWSALNGGPAPAP